MLSPAKGQVVVGNEPAALELSTGKVVATMMGARGVVLIDFETGRADTIGRSGGGPGEFGVPRAIMPWSRGRYAVMDIALSRLTLMKEPATFDTVISVPNGHEASSSAAQSDGIWYSVGARDAHDSLALVRSSKFGNRRDTVARLARPKPTMTPIGRGTAMNLTPEYAPTDAWGLLSDGRVWIARGSDNRVDWVSPEGRLTLGSPRLFSRIRTVDADRHKFHGMPAPIAIDTLKRAIAPLKAPFQGVVAADNGELWIWKNQPAGYKKERYLRIGASGNIISELELPLAHKIVAVSKSFLYILSMNDDEEYLLARHPKPTVP